MALFYFFYRQEAGQDGQTTGMLPFRQALVNIFTFSSDNANAHGAS